MIPHTTPGRVDPALPVIAGHKGAVLDFDFNPFHEHIIASCSDDTTIKVWGIPEAGLTETITEPLVDLHGHGRKVTLLRFHPTANNVLASISADMAVKIWDIEKGSDVLTLEGEHEQLIQDIVWDYTGTLYATSSKDKAVRVMDARANTVASVRSFLDHPHAPASLHARARSINRAISFASNRAARSTSARAGGTAVGPTAASAENLAPVRHRTH